MIKLWIFVLCFLPLCAQEPHEEKIKTLYHGLKPQSIKEMLAFYTLFPTHPLGKKAAERALSLVNQHRATPVDREILTRWPSIQLSSMILSIGNKMQAQTPPLKDDEIAFIEALSNHLLHRRLSGHGITHYEQALELADDQIDIARTVFLYQFGNDLEKVAAYEAALDLMALEILAKLPEKKSIRATLNAMHDLIYFEMGFRFPPQSSWTDAIDTFTYLPSVIDDRYGVCLGVSILYISLGQRLGVPFTVFTPPGHIFLQATLEDDTKVNIETTARGIDIPMEDYLGINTLYLEKRSLKEVMAFSLMNDASVYFGKQDHVKALALYEKAEKFMPTDPLLHYFMAISAWLNQQEELAQRCYSIYLANVQNHQIKPMTMIEDFLEKKGSLEGLKAIFHPTDHTRQSLLKKQELLEKEVANFPSCREALFHLAVCSLELGQQKKALSALEAYHRVDDTNPTCEYYLCALYLERLQYHQAKVHWLRAAKLLTRQQHSAKILLPLMIELTKLLPERLDEAHLGKNSLN